MLQTEIFCTKKIANPKVPPRLSHTHYYLSRIKVGNKERREALFFRMTSEMSTTSTDFMQSEDHLSQDLARPLSALERFIKSMILQFGGVTDEVFISIDNAHPHTLAESDSQDGTFATFDEMSDKAKDLSRLSSESTQKEKSFLFELKKSSSLCSKNMHIDRCNIDGKGRLHYLSAKRDFTFSSTFLTKDWVEGKGNNRDDLVYTSHLRIIDTLAVPGDGEQIYFPDESYRSLDFSSQIQGGRHGKDRQCTDELTSPTSVMVICPPASSPSLDVCLFRMG
jgi:hypothetical protein